MLKIGDKAPAFNMLSDSEEEVSLDKLKGKKFILYFYPKDSTSGCTQEALEFTELKSEFENNGYSIFGVSPDSLASHQKFKEKYKLDITLLVDKDNEVAKKYFAYGEKKMYGKSYYGVIRSTFLISDLGVLEEVCYKVKAKGHAKDILKRIS